MLLAAQTKGQLELGVILGAAGRGLGEREREGAGPGRESERGGVREGAEPGKACEGRSQVVGGAGEAGRDRDHAHTQKEGDRGRAPTW